MFKHKYVNNPIKTISSFCTKNKNMTIFIETNNWPITEEISKIQVIKNNIVELLDFYVQCKYCFTPYKQVKYVISKLTVKLFIYT